MEETKERKVKHFVVGKFKSHTTMLAPDIYAIIRDNVVRACVDVLVMNKQGRVLLGKRNIDPWPSWFIFGGRIVPGESPAEACARTVKGDLGLDVSPERFIFIEVISNAFAKRREPPQQNGCHDLNLFHLLQLEDDEGSLIVVGRQEYERLDWFDIEEIASRPEVFHPATIIVAKKGFNFLVVKKAMQACQR